MGGTGVGDALLCSGERPGEKIERGAPLARRGQLEPCRCLLLPSGPAPRRVHGPTPLSIDDYGASTPAPREHAPRPTCLCPSWLRAQGEQSNGRRERGSGSCRSQNGRLAAAAPLCRHFSTGTNRPRPEAAAANRQPANRQPANHLCRETTARNPTQPSEEPGRGRGRALWLFCIHVPDEELFLDFFVSANHRKDHQLQAPPASQQLRNHSRPPEDIQQREW